MNVARRLLPALFTALLILVAVLASGCCDDCDCPTEPEPVPPSERLLGVWECVRYVLNGDPQPGQIGALMALEDSSRGWVGTPDSPPQSEFTWAATDSMLFLEVPEMGLSTTARYIVRNDTLSLYQGGGFMNPMDVESDYIRWVEETE